MALNDLVFLAKFGYIINNKQWWRAC